jgi:hypothetical protein
MTVNTTTTKVTYPTNGSTQVFSFPFAVAQKTDIKLFFTAIDGSVIEQTPDQFIVTLNPPIDPNPTSVGGTVAFPLSGPLDPGYFVTIVRDAPEQQLTSISNQSIVYPPVVEQAFDYLTMIDQQLTAALARTIQVDITDPVPAPLQPVAIRKSHWAAFDSAGNLTPAASPSGTTIISAAMQPVVAAATIPLAQGLLGTQALINASINAAISALPVSFTTGDLKPTHKTVADSGWIMWVDGTIGDTTSGATIRQNSDTLPLFTLYYDNYTDALCPLFLLSGASTTRAAQGTAGAAFLAHCRMSLPVGAGRAVGIAGNGTGLTVRPPGSTTGVETITQAYDQMVAHNHGFFGYYVPGYLLNLGIGITGDLNYYVISTFFTGTDIQGSSHPMNTMQPTTFCNFMVKL